MKQLILLMIFALGLAGLTGCSSNYRAEAVNKAYPNSEVVFTPTQHQDFIVRDPDGTVWYVRCDNPFSNTITSKSKLFMPQKK